MADIKGDFSVVSRPGGDNGQVEQRVAKLGLTDFQCQPHPATLISIGSF